MREKINLTPNVSRLAATPLPPVFPSLFSFLFPEQKKSEGKT